MENARPLRGLPGVVLVLAALGSGCSQNDRTTAPRPGSAGSDSATAAGLALDHRGPVVEGLARAEKGGKWGFLDGEGRWVVQPAFDWAESFSQGMAAVKRGGSWGYIDARGKLLITPAFIDAGRFSGGLAAVQGKEGWRYIDKQGVVRIKGPFVAAGPFLCGQARVKRERVYLLGSRTHGEYTIEQSELVAADRQRNEGLDEVLEDTGAVEDGEQPELDPAGSRVDEYALSYLFGLEAYQITPEQIGATRGLQVEPQWEEDLWQVINGQGQVVPPAEVRPCGAARPAPAPRVAPSQAALLAQVKGLHRQQDRSRVFRSMLALGPLAVPALLEALQQKSIFVRLNALQIMVRMGPRAAAAIPALITLLDDKNAKVFFHAAWALGRMGPRAAAALPGLVRNFARERELVEAAVLDLGPAAVPELIKLLERGAGKERLYTIQLLQLVGPAAAAARPALRRSLGDAALATEAALALAEVGVKDPRLRQELLPHLLLGLKQSKASRREASAAALGMLGARGAQVTAALARAAASDQNSGVRLAAAEALVTLSPGDAVQPLARLLETAEQAPALALLARLGERAKGAAPAVLKVLAALEPGEETCEQIERVGKTLVKIGGKAKDILAQVTPLLEPNEAEDEEQDQWEVTMFAGTCDIAALKVIKAMGPAGVPAIPRLLRYTQSATSAGPAVETLLEGMGCDALPVLGAMAQKKRNRSLRQLAEKMKQKLKGACSAKTGGTP